LRENRIKGSLLISTDGVVVSDKQTNQQHYPEIEINNTHILHTLQLGIISVKAEAQPNANAQLKNSHAMMNRSCVLQKRLLFFAVFVCYNSGGSHGRSGISHCSVQAFHIGPYPTQRVSSSIRSQAFDERKERRHALYAENESSDTESSPPSQLEDTDTDMEVDPRKLQMELDSMMEPSPTLFGLEKKTMTEEQLKIPLFTGSIVLLSSLVLTFYGFYVFFTGSDPAHDVPLF
jgi:hypothetical protein